MYRGKVVSIIALEHTYHLEHHLYPSVPHHNWPQLARRLDPFFQEVGLKPIKLWF
ncbi:MAG: fatty acid desaturase [Pyrinomonadaceae bacterium]